MKRYNEATRNDSPRSHGIVLQGVMEGSCNVMRDGGDGSRINVKLGWGPNVGQDNPIISNKRPITAVKNVSTKVTYNDSSALIVRFVRTYLFRWPTGHS
jgi:hypothetical protein